MDNKKKQSPFTSIQIIGKHAQRMIQTARSRAQKTKEESQSMTSSDASFGNNNSEQLVVHLSVSSVVRSTFAILAIGLFVLLCYQIRSTLIIFGLAIFLSVVIDPGVRFFEDKFRFPRGFAILSVFILSLTLLFYTIVSLIPIIAEQIQQMATTTGRMIDNFLEDPVLSITFLNAEINTYLTTLIQQLLSDISSGGLLQHVQQFGSSLSNTAQGSILFVVGFAGSLVQFVVRLILTLVLCFFFQLEKEKVFLWARLLLPNRLRRYADDKAEAIQHKLSQWIRGQIVLSFSIALLVFIGLTILRMPYALTLATLAFFMEFIPVVGPILAAIPAVFIGVAQFTLIRALFICLTYYIIQWCENNLLVPLIMHRAVGLSPLAIVFAMLAGVSFPDTIHPILGILLAVPTATVLSIFIQDYRDWQGGKE